MHWEKGFNINVKRRTPTNKDILIKTRKRSEFTWKLVYLLKDVKAISYLFLDSFSSFFLVFQASKNLLNRSIDNFNGYVRDPYFIYEWSRLNAGQKHHKKEILK